MIGIKGLQTKNTINQNIKTKKEVYKVINKITMSNLKTNNKKNWMLEFTDVEVDEILHIFNVPGKNITR
jgi:hypothetical protein